VVDHPCKQADLDLIQGNINLLQERFDDAQKGIRVVKVNKMADDSRQALEKAIAK
jgi:D-serine deaminase-like pyridoxal phosphate-dependent protein